MADKKMRIGVLISGGGTNLQSIIDACEEGRLDARVVVVMSNHEGAYGLRRAEKAGIPAFHVDRTAFETFGQYNAFIRDTFIEREVDVVAMAGYMRLLGKSVLDAFPNRVLNIHPALLPSFAGASGIHDAFDFGVKVTGVTVHLANEKFDDGPILAQECVTIEEDDTLETLKAKIHEVEHRLYPMVLQWMAEDRVIVEGKKARILPKHPV